MMQTTEPIEARREHPPDFGEVLRQIQQTRQLRHPKLSAALRVLPPAMGKVFKSRDVKKPHENPSIGVLLCKGKDDEVVEYSLSRNLSPTLIAQYPLQLRVSKRGAGYA